MKNIVGSAHTKQNGRRFFVSNFNVIGRVGDGEHYKYHDSDGGSCEKN